MVVVAACSVITTVVAAPAPMLACQEMDSVEGSSGDTQAVHVVPLISTDTTMSGTGSEAEEEDEEEDDDDDDEEEEEAERCSVR